MPGRPMPRRKIMPFVSEEIVHAQVCNYIRGQWPKVIFNTDGSGNHLSKAQAGKAKILRSAAGYPDLFIAQARGGFFGLYIELKSENYSPYLKDGKLSTVEHIQKQAAMLQGLVRDGYRADFAVGFDEARKQIDDYMRMPRTNSPLATDLLLQSQQASPAA